MFNPALPKYVQHSAELSYPGPIVCQDAHLYGFILEGNRDKLEALCHRIFAEPSAGKAAYYPLTHYVMLTIGYIRHIYPGTFNIGSMPEAQVIFWVPTVAVKECHGVLVAERLALFPAYVVVDNAYSIVTGREMAGFFKGFGWPDVPTDDTLNPPRLGLDVLGLKEFNPTSLVQRWPLLEVNRLNDCPMPIHSTWSSLKDAFDDLKMLVLGEEHTRIIPGLELPLNLLGDMMHKTVPLVFLKQFRDAGSDERAVYQAILETPSTVTRFKGLRLMDEYQFTILNHLDSYPLTCDMGVVDQKPLFSFKLEMDFVLQDGREVWNAMGSHSQVLAR